MIQASEFVDALVKVEIKINLILLCGKKSKPSRLCAVPGRAQALCCRSRGREVEQVNASGVTDRACTGSRVVILMDDYYSRFDNCRFSHSVRVVIAPERESPPQNVSAKLSTHLVIRDFGFFGQFSSEFSSVQPRAEARIQLCCLTEHSHES